MWFHCSRQLHCVLRLLWQHAKSGATHTLNRGQQNARGRAIAMAVRSALVRVYFVAIKYLMSIFPAFVTTTCLSPLGLTRGHLSDCRKQPAPTLPSHTHSDTVGITTTTTTATTNTTVATTTPSTCITNAITTAAPVCRNWCASLVTKPWTVKCNWTKCDGCSECPGQCGPLPGTVAIVDAATTKIVVPFTLIYVCYM